MRCFRFIEDDLLYWDPIACPHCRLASPTRQEHSIPISRTANAMAWSQRSLLPRVALIEQRTEYRSFHSLDGLQGVLRIGFFERDVRRVADED